MIIIAAEIIYQSKKHMTYTMMYVYDTMCIYMIFILFAISSFSAIIELYYRINNLQCYFSLKKLYINKF